MSELSRLAVVACLMALAPLEALAQAHESRQGTYILRSSTVSSLSIPASVARAHGIAPGSGVAVVNVTVLDDRKPAPAAVPAVLSVEVRELSGRTRAVAMTEDRENGHVSYFGAYRHEPGTTLRFVITAEPAGSNTTLTLRYQDRVRDR